MSNHTADLAFTAFVIAMMVFGLIRGLYRADLSPPDEELAEASYTEDVKVKARSSDRRRFTGQANGGWLRVFIRGTLICVRSPGWSRLVASLFGLDYTVVASTATVRSSRIGRWTASEGAGDQCVIISGRTRRGQDVELALIPRDVDIDRLRASVIAAGAKVDDR